MRLILLLLALFGCSRYHPAPKPPSTVYQIHLFAAGNCESCRQELPAIDQYFQSHPNPRVILQVELIGGGKAGEEATPEYCELFRRDLNLTIPVRPDKHAHLYRHYYSQGSAVPATVIGDGFYLFAPGMVTGEMIEEEVK